MGLIPGLPSFGKLAHYAGEFSGFNDVKSFAEHPLDGRRALLAALALGSFVPGAGLLAKGGRLALAAGEGARLAGKGAAGVLAAGAISKAAQDPTNWKKDLVAAGSMLPFAGGHLTHFMPPAANMTKRDWVGFERSAGKNEFSLDNRISQLDHIAQKPGNLGTDAYQILKRIEGTQPAPFLPPHLLTRAQFEADPRTLFHASHWGAKGSRVGIGNMETMDHAIHMGTPQAGFERFGSNRNARFNTVMIDTTPDRVGTSMAEHPDVILHDKESALRLLPDVVAKEGPGDQRIVKALHDQEQYQLYTPALMQLLAARGGGALPLRNRKLIQQLFSDPYLHERAMRLGQGSVGNGLLKHGELDALDQLFKKDAFPYFNTHEDMGNLSVMSHRSDLVKTHPEILADAVKRGVPINSLPGLKDYPSLRSELIKAKAQGKLQQFDKLSPHRVGKPYRTKQGQVLADVNPADVVMPYVSHPMHPAEQMSEMVAPHGGIGSRVLKERLGSNARDRFSSFLHSLLDNGVIHISDSGMIQPRGNPLDVKTVQMIRDELRNVAKHGHNPHTIARMVRENRLHDAQG